MFHHEKFAWGSLFASLLAWSFLTMRMTDSGAVVNVLIIHALGQAAFAGHALPHIDLGTLPVLFYALLTVLFLGHITSQAATIWLYRA